MSKKSRGREKESIWMGRVGGRQEREDMRPDCNNTGHGQGKEGKTPNMSQVTF